jgi:hypothetical protein
MSGMDGVEVQKWLLWSASQALSIAALGAQPRKANSQPRFHILRLEGAMASRFRAAGM